MTNPYPSSSTDPKIPSNIKRTFRWGLRGSKAETHFTLSTEHVIIYQREDKLIRQIIHFYVDGEQILEKITPSIVLKPRKLEHHFQIENIPCRFVCRTIPIGIGYDIRVFVNEVKVMHV